MKGVLLCLHKVYKLLRKQFLKTKRFFAHSENEKEHKHLGLGQFVLLLSLTPFIFNLSLYDFGSAQSIPSKYQIDPDRFIGLSYEELLTGKKEKPSKPKMNISKKQRGLIRQFTGVSPEQFCKTKPSYSFSIFPSIKNSLRIQLDPLCRHHHRALKRYNAQLAQYDRFVNNQKAEQAHLQQKADGFIVNSHLKPPAPEIDIIEVSKSNFNYLLDQVALDDSIPEISTQEETETQLKQQSLLGNLPQQNQPVWNNLIERVVSANSYQVINYPVWLLGLLLILPVLYVCIKRRAWGLLLFGLAVPAWNYVLYLASILPNAEVATLLQLKSPLFAQLAFIWFLLTGHINSRAFGIFILLLLLSTLLPELLGNLSLFDPSYVSHSGYSLLKAQLPIVIFILIAGLGRLLVKGAKENGAILYKLGLSDSLKFVARSLVLWIPMAVLCLPFFYLTEHLLPKKITHKLHENKVLQFDYGYEKGFLDNSLQSAAHIADDINFAWHLVVEERKAYLYATDQELQKLDFRRTVNKHYDQVIPQSLKFEESNSDVALFGWLVDLATEETQKSINKSFQTLRNDIREKLGNLASDKEKQLKAKSTNVKNDVLSELETLEQEGKAIIVANNTSAQSTLWWTINYIQAAHQLALLFFAFVCVKSFMYVFARVSFNQKTGTVFTLANTTSNAADSNTKEQEQKIANTKIESGTIKATGLDYTIKSDKANTYYISRRYQCRGKPPKITLPQASKSFIARLFNKAYTMNAIVIEQGDADVVCTATKGIEFFEWVLAKDETVVFDYHNFVGMSQDLKLSTLISPRISSLLLGRMIYSQASGPGTLILMAKGRAEVCDASSQAGSLPPELMIAMQKETKLHVDSELDMLNIYLSSAYIRPASGKILVDVDSQRGAKTGLGSFIRYFVFPG